MHKVLKGFPCSFDGTTIEQLNSGDERDFGALAEGLKKAGYIDDIDARAPALREDGPTIAEFVSAGYAAAAYPPSGYASRSTSEEIAAAISAEEEARHAAMEADRAELAKMTNVELAELAKAEGAGVEAGDNKGTMVDKILAGRISRAAGGN